MKNILKNSKILLISSISATMTACHATGQNVRKKLAREEISEMVNCVPHNRLQELEPVNSVIGSYALAREYRRYAEEFFPGGNVVLMMPIMFGYTLSLWRTIIRLLWMYCCLHKK